MGQHPPLGPSGQPQRSTLSSWVRAPFAQMRMRRRGRFGEIAALARAVDAQVHNGCGPDAPRVLVVQIKTGAVLGGYSAVLAQALRLRGVEVGLLVCGGGQPICEVGWARRTHPFPCNRCSYFTETWARAQSLPLFRLSDGIPWGSDATRAPRTAPTPTAGGLDYVDATRVSVPRFFLAAQHEGFPLSPEAVSDFALSAYGVEQAVEPVIEEFAPDVVVLYNGLTTSELVIKHVAERRGIRAVTYSSGHMPGSLMFSGDEPAERMDSEASWREIGERPLTPEQQRAIEAYLDARWAGRGTYENYYERPRDQALRAALDVTGYDRVMTLFTNIPWDTGCLDRNIAFSSMREWVMEAIATAERHPRTALIVRVHPEELRWGSAESIEDAIAETFDALPPNIRVVAPGDSINSYALMDASDVVLTYTSTVGLEAAVRGIPVAVFGAAHYRGKGFTSDVEDAAEFDALFAGATKVPRPRPDRAWRYAFMFFFRMCIPFPAVSEESPQVDALSHIAHALEAVMPGADPYLDFVCDRIVGGGQFLLPEELVVAHA